MIYTHNVLALHPQFHHLVDPSPCRLRDPHETHVCSPSIMVMVLLIVSENHGVIVISLDDETTRASHSLGRDIALPVRVLLHICLVTAGALSSTVITAVPEIAVPTKRCRVKDKLDTVSLLFVMEPDLEIRQRTPAEIELASSRVKAVAPR